MHETVKLMTHVACCVSLLFHHLDTASLSTQCYSTFWLFALSWISAFLRENAGGGMAGRKQLEGIRSMTTAGSVEANHAQLIALLKAACARSPPCTHELCKVAVLCGAFCRRVAVLDAIPASDVARYCETLCTTINDVSSPMQITLFAYPLGEAESLRISRRLCYRQQLDNLTKNVPASRWDIERIACCIGGLSLFERAPVRSGNCRVPVKRIREGAETSGDGGAVAVRWQQPLRDPISLSVIKIPARGVHCQHREMFDLTAFVRSAQVVSVRRGDVLDGCSNPKWASNSGNAVTLPAALCPICGRSIPLKDIRVDEGITRAMAHYSDNGGTLSSDSTVVWDVATASYAVVGRSADVRSADVYVDSDDTILAQQLSTGVVVDQ
ncbi:unnamed protein product [Trypanosoma congolense IL3000]|uniref:WGS project CAEQ00000000 data, annotated contig 1001 n=1 Tax=Trypanosoma congolense (strain IL3000) TaxID=1068625 RepID=F9W353_TRYCI|nr:unnamed protein product [Trypanosoma congolense IL3000]